MPTKKAGRPDKIWQPHPAPLVSTTTRREFDRIARRYGLHDKRTVLLLGIQSPRRLRQNPVFRDQFLSALEKSPSGIARLIQFVHDEDKRRLSLPDFLEQNPQLMTANTDTILSAYPHGREISASAVNVAKREIERRNGVGIKRRRKRS